MPALTDSLITDDHLCHYAANIAHCASISDYLEDDVTDDDNECHRLLEDSVLDKRFAQLDIVTPSSGRTCCFTKAYSKKIEGSGSYYQTVSSVQV